MTKRLIVAFLWFSAAWFGYEVVWSLAGVTRLAGPVVASAVATFVAVDPMTLFWPRSSEAVGTKPDPSAAGI